MASRLRILIEIGKNILSEGYVKIPRENAGYHQSIRIFYTFIGEIMAEPIRAFALKARSCQVFYWVSYYAKRTPKEVTINLTDGHNGHLTSRKANFVTEQMVKNIGLIRTTKHEQAAVLL